ncbi:hypothetical protein TNCV_2442431 [Trichonephila clavipes]|nr:hypothetical protein TNCV_2442431 [Trichonephila clavipes]
MMCNLTFLQCNNFDGQQFIFYIVTRDETLFHHFVPTNKKVTMEWKYPGSPTTKKFNVTTAAETIFSDSLCVFLVDNPERGQTLNAVRYCDTLTRLRKSSDANGGAG